MIRFMSDTNAASDIKNGRLRLQVSCVRHLVDPSDTEIRNAVEGYASQGELSDAAERSFERWYDRTFVDLPLADADEVHERAGLCAAYVSGYLSAAEDMGQLPAGDPT